MAATNRRVTEGAHATLDALHNKEGKVPNKALNKATTIRKKHARIPVVAARVERLPVRRWACESCEARGRNWLQMQDHVKQTGHTHFGGDYTLAELMAG